MLEALVAPFADFVFMKRALAASLILAMGGAPLGVFLSLRRMTLVGDALSHAILPGVALGFLIGGFSLWALTLGGFTAAIVVAMIALLLTRTTQLKEDAAFTLLYLLSLGIGVTLISMKRGSVDLLHLLFGDILAIDADTLKLVAGVSCLSLFTIAGLYRRLVIEGLDPDFLSVAGHGRRAAGLTNPLFFTLLMVNLVASFQALGTLMALGLMILPALAARFWARNIDTIIPSAIGFAAFSAYAGLLLSYHAGLPSGPAIVLVAGGIALLSALCGRYGSALAYIRQDI